MTLIYNPTFDSGTRVLSLLDKAGNVISSCEVPSKSKELTLKAIADNSSVVLTKVGTLSNTYEVNTGSGWSAYTFGTVINLNSGESCKWRCSAHPTTQSNSDYVKFVMTGSIEASGNCNSMLSSDFENMTSLSGYNYAFIRLFYGCKALTKAPELPAKTLATYCYYSMFAGCSSLAEVRVAAIISAPDALKYWLSGVSPSGDFYCNPNATIFPSGTSGILSGWNRFVLGAEDTGNTTAMYHNGATGIVRVGYSSYGTCYSAQGWAGFKTLTGMHGAGYTFSAQTPLTMYFYDSLVSAYSCEANDEDGFTGTMYDVGNGKGYLTLAQQNTDGYFLSETPSGLTLTATADKSLARLLKVGTLSNTYEVNTGSGWSAYTFGTVINLNSGESCKWRCSAHPTAQSSSNYVYFGTAGTIKASGNCNSMLRSDFENMTSLSGYPYAFFQLFSGCTSLVQAPELPATTLANYCYSNMFNSCISLTQAATLPATTLATSCYIGIFYGCSSLTEVRIKATTTATNALNSWLYGVAATGTVYANPNFTGLPTDSTSGVPENWVRRNINDYPTT